MMKKRLINYNDGGAAGAGATVFSGWNQWYPDSQARIYSTYDTGRKKGRRNDTGGTLSYNDATDLAMQICNSKWFSFPNAMLSSDTDTPVRILQQVYNKPNWQTLQSAFTANCGGDLYQYLISFCDQPTIDSIVTGYVNDIGAYKNDAGSAGSYTFQQDFQTTLPSDAGPGHSFSVAFSKGQTISGIPNAISANTITTLPNGLTPNLTLIGQSWVTIPLSYFQPTQSVSPTTSTTPTLYTVTSAIPNSGAGSLVDSAGNSVPMSSLMPKVGDTISGIPTYSSMPGLVGQLGINYKVQLTNNQSGQTIFFIPLSYLTPVSATGSSLSSGVGTTATTSNTGAIVAIIAVILLSAGGIWAYSYFSNKPKTS